MRIDLHLHSTASDGAFPPREVVRRARSGGLDLIALADHDTAAGVPEAMEAAADHLRVVPAIEISAAHDGRDLHILGYGIDPAAPSLREYQERARAARAVRIRSMIERLGELDVRVAFDDVVAAAGPVPGALGRPHLARVLLSAGHVSTLAEAFDRYIGDEGPAYVPTRLLDVPGAIALIRGSGALAVWAHPPQSLLGPALDGFVAAGLQGLEAYRPRTADAELQRLLAEARRHDLLVTGGSDWHGDWHGDLGGFHLARDPLHAFLDRLGL